MLSFLFFFFSSRRRHTRLQGDWSSDVCSSDLHGKTRVTMSDKSNAVPAHLVWQQKFKAISKEYPAITPEHRYVDALAVELVREPERFQVIVTNNLYGDILSDLGAGLVGGLGLAASAN